MTSSGSTGGGPGDAGFGWCETTSSSDEYGSWGMCGPSCSVRPGQGVRLNYADLAMLTEPHCKE